MKIVTWNVNSLKVRLPQLIDWIKEHEPDICALQETKLTDENFPRSEIEALGYHYLFSGQPAYNGVAILSKQAITEPVAGLPAYNDPQKRLLAATIEGVRVINVYIPNGSSVDSDKYLYKLDWLTQLESFVNDELTKHEKVILLGDFNIAPADADVHDPAEWEGQVLVSKPEREHFQSLLQLGLHDTFRLFPQAAGLYSWWDYRAMAFRRNRGLRIDLILSSQALAQSCQSCAIDKIPRKHERPSDHAPVMATFC